MTTVITMLSKQSERDWVQLFHPRQSDGGLGWCEVGYESAVCPGSQKGQLCPGCIKHSSASWSKILLYTALEGVVPPGVPCAVLGATILEKHKIIGEHQEEGAWGGERPCGQDVVRGNWDHWFGGVWRKEGWGVISWKSITSSRGVVDGRC